jgi:predicted NBD/HSP70 family sugar kinase|tara:strand:+ start:6622 stop:7791 length:1170 start_codon:yes stop_codon:yes gene_type:complete
MNTPNSALKSDAKNNDSVDEIKKTFDLNRTQRSALGYILEAGELPRSRLAEYCGVSAPAITRIARELIARDLLVVSGKGGNTRGQPSTNLAVNPKGAFSLGVFIERDALSFALLNFVGDPVSSKRVTGLFDDPLPSMPALLEELDGFIAAEGPNPERIVGLGVAITGNFVLDGHTVVPPKDMKKWMGLDFAELFRAHYSFPILIENDGSAATLGEQLTGQGQKYKTFFYIHMANGLGGGYVLDGKLVRGAHGNASELGHLVPAPTIRPTLRSLAENLDRPLGDISYKEIESMFAGGDEKFFAWLNQAIANIQPVVTSIAVLMDPQAIVLGGKFPPNVVNYIIEKLFIDAYGDHWADVARPAIVPAKNYSADAAVYGAAALPLHQLLLAE